MEGRVLADLKVADLRRELEKRQKDKVGVKQVLVDRLKEALEEDGHDPLTYRFTEVEGSRLDDATDQSVCCSVSLCDLTSVQSVNGDEADAGSQTKDDAASLSRNEQTSADTVNEEQTEQKKIADEPVTYVVQVGDQEEDLDYDLKAENNDAVENCSNEKQSEEKEATVENKPVTENTESAKSSKTGLENRKNLWVSNLPKTVKAADLKQHFSKAGKVVSATVVMSTRSPGGCYGFLQMASAEDAANAARYFDCSEYNGHKISVEATERKSPTLTSKLNASTARTKHTALAKTEVSRPPRRGPLNRFRRYQLRGRSSWARRARYAARKGLEQRRVAPRESATETRREPPRLTRPPPPRMNPRYLAYQSLKRASLLLAAARYGSSRSAHPREPLPPRYSRGPRIPPYFSRPSSEFERPPVRYPSPDRRNSRPMESPRRPNPRVLYGDRRRSITQAYESERSRPLSPPPRSMPPRRSEPISRGPPARIREPMPPPDRRRSVPAPARSFDSYSRVSKIARPPAETSRTFNRPSDPPRIEGRTSYERMEFRRPQANGSRQPPSPVSHPFNRESEGYRSPYELDAVRRPSPVRAYPSRLQATPPRRDYRDMSRSPPRSRNMALMRPYPDSSPHHDMRMDHPIRDRSPMGFNPNGGPRPKVVDYGHRSEPRDDYPGWRGESPRIQTPPGHTWKPAGHSFVSNYGGRGGRRY